jgi:hypothetical protein
MTSCSTGEHPIVGDTAHQEALDAGVVHRGELVGDLLGRPDDGGAAAAGDEVLVERGGYLGVEGGAVQADAIDEVAGRLEVTVVEDLLVAASRVRLGIGEDDGPVCHRPHPPGLHPSGLVDRRDQPTRRRIQCRLSMSIGSLMTVDVDLLEMGCRL